MLSIDGIRTMRVCVLSALAVVLLLGIAGDKGVASSADDAVRGTVLRYHDALAAMDSVSARALLGGDLVVLENGYVESATEYLSHHLPADMAFASAVPGKRGPTRVTIRGNVAWTTSTTRVKGEYKGREVDTVVAELMVLSLVGGKWKIEAIHWSSRKGD